MTLSLDPDLLRNIAAIGAEGSPPPLIQRDDWRSLRALGETGVAALDASLPANSQIGRQDLQVTSDDGTDVPVRWYTPPDHRPGTGGPAVVYFHGGGMIMGSVNHYDRLVASYVADSGVPMLSVDYRLAPEYPHPTPVGDCYAAVRWIAAHAERIGVDPRRIAVMGDSGGGGLAAATALLAREGDLALAKQILIYPMLDDRNTTPDPELVAFAGWTYDNNYTGWHALLGESIGTTEVPPTAAPARAKDLSNLPSAYIEVGELDIFRNESMEYARRLALGGTSVELHVHPGCPHGFDRVAPTAPVVERSRGDRMRVLRSL